MNGIILDSPKFINLQVRLWRIGCHASEQPLFLRGGKNLSLLPLFYYNYRD